MKQLTRRIRVVGTKSCNAKKTLVTIILLFPLIFYRTYIVNYISSMFGLKNMITAGNSSRNARMVRRKSEQIMAVSGVIYSVDFEVYGKVQGVFFRKYTQKMAQKLGLVGWVQNTPQNTVTGCIQGDPDGIREMKYWLTHTGSPMSTIKDCKFKDEREVSIVEFPNFVIRK